LFVCCSFASTYHLLKFCDFCYWYLWVSISCQYYSKHFIYFNSIKTSSKLLEYVLLLSLLIDNAKGYITRNMTYPKLGALIHVASNLWKSFLLLYLITTELFHYFLKIFKIYFSAEQNLLLSILGMLGPSPHYLKFPGYILKLLKNDPVSKASNRFITWFLSDAQLEENDPFLKLHSNILHDSTIISLI
jgi:hypothetical protein